MEQPDRLEHLRLVLPNEPEIKGYAKHEHGWTFLISSFTPGMYKFAFFHLFKAICNVLSMLNYRPSLRRWPSGLACKHITRGEPDSRLSCNPITINQSQKYNALLLESMVMAEWPPLPRC